MAELRIDNIELVAELAFQKIDLVLERDQNVAHFALRERGRCAAAAAIEHGHIGEQLGDELLRLVVALLGLECIAPGGEIRIASVARGLGNWE